MQDIVDAKLRFYELWKIVDDKSRRHNLVRGRAAFVAAFRPYCRAVDLANAIGKDHATVIYYVKIHEAQMMYKDYKIMYDSARELLKSIYSEVEADIDSLEMIVTQLKNANERIEELLDYKFRYLELVEVFEKFNTKLAH